MYVVFLFVAALLFFIADRKLRAAFIPGILITVTACYGFVYRCFLLFVNQNMRSAMSPRSIFRTPSGRAIVIISLTLLVSALCCFALLSLGKLLSVAIFKASKDGKGYSVLARIFCIIGGALLIPFGGYFIYLRSFISRPASRASLNLMRFIGTPGFAKYNAYIIYGGLLIALGIVFIILFCTPAFRAKQLKAADPAAQELKLRTGMSTTGIILSCLGNGGVIITALVGLISWHQVYFFNGYGYTKILCILFLLLMILGLTFVSMSLYKIAVKGQLSSHKGRMIFSLILIGITFIDCVWLISNAHKFSMMALSF
ncbi:MAG: hypothetical protein IKS75_01920 [Clostridiales bacterium]|nr:hypothetical protein [Clostridiales bacterium]